MNNEEILRMYNDGVSASSIAKHYNCGTSTITNRLKSMGVELRTHILPRPNKDELERLYHIEKLAARQIAIKYNTSTGVVMGWLRKEGIKLRAFNKRNETKHKPKIHPKKLIITNPDASNKLNDRRWLRNHYVKKMMHIMDISRMLRVSEGPVHNYVRLHRLYELRLRYRRFVVYRLAREYITNNSMRMSSLTKVNDWVRIEMISEMVLKLGGEIRHTVDYNDIPFKRISNKEQELYDWICTEITDEVIQSYKMSIKERYISREIDIFIPSLNFGIEFNGILWHNENQHDINAHLDKKNNAKSLGIDLMYVWEDDWENKNEIIKSQIRNKLNKSKRIAARKCKIIEITDAKTKKEFFNKNHIQGFTASTVCYGLEYNGKIVCMISFMKNEEYYVLNRYCNILNHSVIGGISKLLKHFENEYSDVKQIRSYSHDDWYDGNVYNKIGFEYMKKNPPSYWYVNTARVANGGGRGREHRSAYMKKNIIKKFDLTEDFLSMTEDQLVRYVNDNYGRKYPVLNKIWNCGTTTWVKNRQ